MSKLLLNISAVLAIFMGSLDAQAWGLGGGGRNGDGPLKTKLKSGSVYVARKHNFVPVIGRWGLWGAQQACETFKGTFEGNNVHFKAEASGGSGGYRHVIVTTFNNSYKLNTNGESQFEDRRNGNGEFSIDLPELSDVVGFVQQTVLLMTTDSAGNTATDSLTFTVSRPVLLSVSQSPQARDQSCFQRYAPYESMTGVLSNATNNLSTIEIKQGLQHLWTSSKGWQWGVFVSPLSPLMLGNLISFNYSYFHETSKTVSETTEVSTHYNFDPGDYMQVYAQPTRYVTAYDATLVDACGNKTSLPGAYLFQWWGFAYHVYPVNPYSKVAPPLEAIGAPPMNTCPDTLTPGSGKEIDMRRTNE